MTDPISDMLIRIKNAQMVKKPVAAFPYSKIKLEIARVLEKAGYLGGVQKRNRKAFKFIEVNLVYENGEGKISDIKRVSKSSRRIYRASKEIFGVKNGGGLGIYSTSLGLLTDKEARKQKVGGELLLEVW